MTAILEGELTESTQGSGTFDKFRGTWAIGKIKAGGVSTTLTINGTMSYTTRTEYPSTSLYVLQESLEGNTFGDYSVDLSSVLTHVGIVDENNPYDKEGFSLFSYISDTGSGGGWTYDELVSPTSIQMNGHLSSPLRSIVFATLDGFGSQGILRMLLERVDLNKPPASDVKVSILAPNRVSPGQTIDYVAQYWNAGFKEATNVVIVEKLPGEVSYLYSVGGVYNESAHEVVWNLDNIPAGSNGNLITKVTIQWGLSPATMFSTFISLPKEPILVTVDPAAQVQYNYTVVGENQVQGTTTVLNNVQSVLTDVSAYLEPAQTAAEFAWKISEADIELSQSVLSVTDGTWYRVTMKAHEYSDAIDIGTTILDFGNNAIDYYETQGFIDWAYGKGYISQQYHDQRNNGNKAMFFTKSVLLKVVEKTKLGNSVSILANEILSAMGLNSPSSRHALETEFALNDAFITFEQAYAEYLDDQSYASSSHNNSIAVARDPNIKYGPEGKVSTGQTLEYTIEYENEGEGSAFGVYFIDVLDSDLDDSTLIIGPVFSTMDGSVIAPAGTYNPTTRTITWFVGEVGPSNGGYSQISANVRNDAPDGTEIINFGTVYFPSVPETTRTNAIVSIVGLNQAPVATNDHYATNSDIALTVGIPGVLVNDIDPDGDPLVAILVDVPSHGNVTLNGNGSFTYTPDASRNGHFTFTNTATDGEEDRNIATVTITVNALVPATTSITPTSKTVGDPGFNLTVLGNNFTAGSVVCFNGADRVTTYVSSSNLTAAILASDLLAAGTDNITVFNPAPGGGTSNIQTFTVNPTPRYQVELLISQVERLVRDGVFTQGAGNSLTAKLKEAKKQLDSDRTDPAINMLGAFINEISAMIKAGRLSPQLGQPLIDSANIVITQLKGI